MSFDIADLLRMEDHDVVPTCLSAERHKPRDFLFHYLGCEQYFQRDEYLTTLSTEQIKQVETRLLRIQHLRAALMDDPTEGRHLIQNLTASFHRWRNSKDYQEGITRVRELRTTHFATNGLTQKEVKWPGHQPAYDPDVDTYAYLIRFKNGKPVHEIGDNRFREQFPCYRISVKDLIYQDNDDSPLIGPHGTINYVHLPANNMSQAITKYFMHKPTSKPKHDTSSAMDAAFSGDLVANGLTQAGRILGPKYWKSQQQSSSVTGKYLGPMCEAISGATDEVKENIALFMPYLHWDTARHQTQISHAIKKETERHRREKLLHEKKVRGMRRARQRGLQLLNAQSRQPGSAFRLENRGSERAGGPVPTAAKQPPLQWSATGAFAKMMKRHGRRFSRLAQWSAFSKDERGRVVAGTRLGQVLIDAAVVYEAMATLRERRLLGRYLHADAPLHPRRTLEQTNEWTLSLSWHASARDQVLHRATRPKQVDLRSADPSAREWRDRIRKLPRVMMIDQLWLWILDDRTVLTCFPDDGDLGHSNHLPGIHARIRDGLLEPGSGPVNSVVDVALLVLGEVQIARSTMGGIKPQDGMTHVMQVFRQAIRDVASKHSFGAEQYWEWARIFSRLAHTDVDNGLSDLIVPFLDIGKEGELQGQIKSVVRDLDTMLRITLEQKDMIERFQRTVGLLSPRAGSRADVGPLLAEIQSGIADLGDMRRSADGISDSLDYLIQLKQQQVTVVQAWQSMKQGEDNQQQNLTLLVFTVLPMSFISSVFGMNNKEITGRDAPMTLAQQFRWMLPISFAIVAITYYTAFGNPGKIARDALRWACMRWCELFRLGGPGDLSLGAVRDALRGRAPRRRRDADQAWERRRSEEMARDAQARRAGTRRAAVTGHALELEPVWPDPAVMMPPPPLPPPAAQQTGMFAVYHDLNHVSGRRRPPTPPREMV